MFTGIVEEVGHVLALDLNVGGEQEASARDATIEIRGPLVVSDARLGDSICVAGVCLTVTELTEESFRADVMPETLRRSTLGSLRVGSPVNLERALAAGGRLGGHVVQGHVDGVGMLLAREPGPRWDELTFRVPRELARFIAEKGSITVSGVSLTVTGVTADTFGVALVPTTLAGTTLGSLAVGDAVNLEVDVLAKYVERLMTSGTPAARGQEEVTR